MKVMNLKEKEHEMLRVFKRIATDGYWFASNPNDTQDAENLVKGGNLVKVADLFSDEKTKKMLAGFYALPVTKSNLLPKVIFDYLAGEVQKLNPFPKVGDLCVIFVTLDAREQEEYSPARKNIPMLAKISEIRHDRPVVEVIVSMLI